MGTREPCGCGCPDCPCCYPFTWKENMLMDFFLDESGNNEDKKAFQDFVSDWNKDESIERYLDGR